MPRRVDASDLHYVLEYSDDLESWVSFQNNGDELELRESWMEGDVNYLGFRLSLTTTSRYWRVRSDLKPAE